MVLLVILVILLSINHCAASVVVSKWCSSAPLLKTTGFDYCCAGVYLLTPFAFNIWSMVEWSQPISFATARADFKI